jgi:hypothetical protein
MRPIEPGDGGLAQRRCESRSGDPKSARSRFDTPITIHRPAQTDVSVAEQPDILGGVECMVEAGGERRNEAECVRCRLGSGGGVDVQVGERVIGTGQETAGCVERSTAQEGVVPLDPSIAEDPSRDLRIQRIPRRTAGFA